MRMGCPYPSNGFNGAIIQTHEYFDRELIMAGFYPIMNNYKLLE